MHFVNLSLNIFVISKIRKTYKLINFPDFVLMKIFNLVIRKTDIWMKIPVKISDWTGQALTGGLVKNSISAGSGYNWDFQNFYINK